MIKAQRSRPPAPKTMGLFERQKPADFSPTVFGPGDSAQKRPKSTEMLGCPPDLSSLRPCETDLMGFNGMSMIFTSSVVSPASHSIPKWPQATMPVGSSVQLYPNTYNHIITPFSRADCHAQTHVDGCSIKDKLEHSMWKVCLTTSCVPTPPTPDNLGDS